MTDLIAGLAARTLGLTPVLQPRVTSMFAQKQLVLDHEPSDRVTENTAWNSDPEAFDAEEMDAGDLRNEEPISSVQRLQSLVNKHSTLPLVRSPRANLPRTQKAEPAIAEPDQPLEPEHPGSTAAIVPQPEQTIMPQSEQTTVQRLVVAPTIAPQSSEVAMPPSANPPSPETEPPELQSSQLNQAAISRSPGDALSSDSSQNQVSLSPVSPQALEPFNQVDVPFQTQSDPIQLVPSNSTPSQRSTPIQPEKTETIILSQPNAERNLEPNIKWDQNSEITPNTQIPNTQIIEPESQQFSAPEASEGVVLPYGLPPTSHSIRNNTIAPRTAQDITPRSSEIAVVPPTTIQVTIGRIDIRAVAAPPPTRTRPSSSPPKLSLDDYLRSRSGG